MLLEGDQMLSSKVKVLFLWATTVVHAIFSPRTVSTVHVWIGPRLLIARYCLLFSELFSILLYTYYSQNYVGIICSGGELCMNMLFLHADTSIFVIAHPSVSLSLCLSVYLFCVVYICHVNGHSLLS